MQKFLRQALSERPVTAAVAGLSLVLFAAVSSAEIRTRIPAHELLTAWGAASTIELWNGAWWRIFVTAFHHGGILHLALNLCVLWYLGGLLEPRLGSLPYAIFLAGALTVTGVIQTAFADFVGLSGVVFAVFGALLTLRQREAAVRERFDEQMVVGGLIWLFVCVPLSRWGILPVANAAHFAGLAYGALAGWLWWGQVRFRRLALTLFATAHLLLLPALNYLMHPVLDGRYHWWLAENADARDDDEATVRHSVDAIKCDPKLTVPWEYLAKVHEKHGRRLRAWEDLLSGIRHNPGFTEAIELARGVWSRFESEAEREQALRLLRDKFGESAPTWEVALAPGAVEARSARGEPLAAEGEGKPIGPVRLMERPLDEYPEPAGKLPAPDPKQPGSAEEGVGS